MNTSAAVVMMKPAVRLLIFVLVHVFMYTTRYSDLSTYERMHALAYFIDRIRILYRLLAMIMT